MTNVIIKCAVTNQIHSDSRKQRLVRRMVLPSRASRLESVYVFGHILIQFEQVQEAEVILVRWEEIYVGLATYHRQRLESHNYKMVVPSMIFQNVARTPRRFWQVCERERASLRFSEGLGSDEMRQLRLRVCQLGAPGGLCNLDLTFCDSADRRIVSVGPDSTVGCPGWAAA